MGCFFVLADARLGVRSHHECTEEDGAISRVRGSALRSLPWEVAKRYALCAASSPRNGKSLDQSAEARPFLPRREETGVPEPCGDQALPDRPEVWFVSSGRRRGRP